MATRQMQFQLTGFMPLLMHADNVDAADALTAWRKAPGNKNISVAGDDRSPPWTYQSYLYNDGEHVAMPQENIMIALRQAGTQIIMKKQKTFKEVSQSGLLISSEFCKFEVPNVGQIPIHDINWVKSATSEKLVDFQTHVTLAAKHGFRLYTKRASVGSSKHIRVRPRFDQWTVSGTIAITAPEISDEILKTLFERAGRVGLCDWRPGCKTPGCFGMFEAKVF